VLAIGGFPFWSSAFSGVPFSSVMRTWKCTPHQDSVKKFQRKLKKPTCIRLYDFAGSSVKVRKQANGSCRAVFSKMNRERVENIYANTDRHRTEKLPAILSEM